MVPSSEKDELQLGIGDDAALFTPQMGRETVLTCDWSLEGTHFLRDIHPPDSIGWKCLARAVSDIAAMGATPKCFLLSLALPSSHTGVWLNGFIRGLRRASRHFRCLLAGGDTTQAKKVLINVTAIGEVPIGGAIRRSGASPGDIVYVSGQLGEAELGLQVIRNWKPMRPTKSALRTHLYPEPRLALGTWLAEHGLATSMMDLSDGLSTDLNRLCAASRVGARIDAAKVPVVRAPSQVKVTETQLLNFALHGGEDYELLFTVSPRKSRRIPRAFRGTLLTRVGEITHGRRVQLAFPDGRKQPLHAHGWDPFRR